MFIKKSKSFNQHKMDSIVDFLLLDIDLVVFSHSCQTYDPAVVGLLSRLEMPIISEMKFPHLVKGSEVQGIY